jgi:hypothetical protein
LKSATNGAFPVDGILGYEFFASAEVRFDFERMQLTIARPGSLPLVGEPFSLDTDRQYPELDAKIDGKVTRVVIDTGDANELLVFGSFLREYPGTVSYAGARAVPNYAVGGSTSAVATMVDELDLGPFRLYNRQANVILSDSGAFADRIDGANVGAGTLRSFIATFDLANRMMYLAKTPSFDDGSDRARAESNDGNN